MTVKEQQEQGRVKQEKKRKGESEMKERDDDMRTADTLELCMCVTRIRMCEVYAQCQCCRKNVRVTCECVYTPRHTHSCCYHVGANPCGNDPCC